MKCMTRRARFLCLMLAFLVVPLICGASLVWGFPLYWKWKFERTFLSNELNRQIFARNPTWSSKIQDVEVTDLFAANGTIDQFVKLAAGAGFHCDNMRASTNSSRSLVCYQSLSYDWFCERWPMLEAEYDDVNSLRSVTARYSMDCL